MDDTTLKIDHLLNPSLKQLLSNYSFFYFFKSITIVLGWCFGGEIARWEVRQKDNSKKRVLTA